jgi:hypothetical protein
MSASPLPGTITVWSALDGVGRIQLASGEVLRFGGSACSFPPAVGLAVLVHGVEPHRLGGNRATGVTLASPGDADLVLDERDPLPGITPTDAGLAEFVELTDEVGLLGVVVREPIRSRPALRRWLERGGGQVDFANARCPLVRAGQVAYRVWLCMAEVAGGRGVVSFALDTPFSVQRERALALAGARLDPEARVDMLPPTAPLVELVRRCAEGEVAVIAHQARGFLLPAPAWIARVAAAPPGRALRAWTKITIAEGRDPILTGLAALRLPDLFLRGAAAEPEALLEEAALALVERGTPPERGEMLGRCVVTGCDDEWIGLVP